MIKAIETVYKGYRFRSRLEARWAVFFDSLNINWEYEKEGFSFDGISYLPDFWIPHLSLWVEIKPEIDGKTIDLMRKFRDAQEWPVALVSGTPGDEQTYFFCWDVTDSGGGAYEDYESYWCESNGIITLDVNPGRRDRTFISDNLMGIDLPWFNYPKDFGIRMDRIHSAYGAARSARFEHGEHAEVEYERTFAGVIV